MFLYQWYPLFPLVTFFLLQGKIRQSLQTRGTKMMTSLFQHFKTIDKSGDGLLSKDEIKTAFQKFRIQVSDYVRNLDWWLPIFSAVVLLQFFFCFFVIVFWYKKFHGFVAFKQNYLFIYFIYFLGK